MKQLCDHFQHLCIFVTRTTKCYVTQGLWRLGPETQAELVLWFHHRSPSRWGFFDQLPLSGLVFGDVKELSGKLNLHGHNSGDQAGAQLAPLHAGQVRGERSRKDWKSRCWPSGLQHFNHSNGTTMRDALGNVVFGYVSTTTGRSKCATNRKPKCRKWAWNHLVCFQNCGCHDEVSLLHRLYNTLEFWQWRSQCANRTYDLITDVFVCFFASLFFWLCVCWWEENVLCVLNWLRWLLCSVNRLVRSCY